VASQKRSVVRVLEIVKALSMPIGNPRLIWGIAPLLIGKFDA